MVLKMTIFFYLFLIAVFCPTNGNVEGPLHREDVSEGSCILPYPSAVTPSRRFFIKSIRNSRIPFYVPMGSQHMYRSYAQYLLGRPASTQNELDSMNLRIHASKFGHFHSTGYKNFINQQCFFKGSFFRVSCYATRGSSGTDLASIRQTTDTLVYTDNKSVFLILRCVNGKENDWKLLSNQPTIQPEVKEKILQKLMKFGFTNSTYYSELKYL